MSEWHARGGFGQDKTMSLWPSARCASLSNAVSRQSSCHRNTFFINAEQQVQSSLLGQMLLGLVLLLPPQ
jgi:hypothetical protein